MMPSMRRGFALRLYLLASYFFILIAGPVLRRRRLRDKEHPTRWVEKKAQGLAPRPGDGPVIWLNAVGLGEVLSLRRLIVRMHALRPDISFLVTSTTKASAVVFERNLPPRAMHQFLPIDAAPYRERFLEHFRPDLCLWVEQDLWPGFVHALNRRSIPQAIIAARMNAQSFQAHMRVAALYRDLYQAMAMVTAQDASTATHLKSLSADAIVIGSLKPAAPDLNADVKELLILNETLHGRRIWAVAPSHAADEQAAIAAHHILAQSDPTALLVIAPRFPDRRNEIAQALGALTPLRSLGQIPGPDDRFWIFDTFGELGLLYRLTQTVLVGGTFSNIQGHNPWEAAALDTAILHGPYVENFAADFGQLDQAGAACMVKSDTEIVQVLLGDDLPLMAKKAAKCIKAASARTDQLAHDIIALLDR